MRRLVAALVLGLAAAGGAAATEPQAAAAPPPKISAEDFGALPFFLDPKISPDGKRVVAISVLEGKRGPVVGRSPAVRQR